MLPRSEVPENFIPAQATARVTTFSFPLFILSGAPPGRLLSQWNHFSAAPGASESHTWKIASPGRWSVLPLSLSGCPVAGRGQNLSQSAFHVKRIFDFFYSHLAIFHRTHWLFSYLTKIHLSVNFSPGAIPCPFFLLFIHKVKLKFDPIDIPQIAWEAASAAAYALYHPHSPQSLNKEL